MNIFCFGPPPPLPWIKSHATCRCVYELLQPRLSVFPHGRDYPNNDMTLDILRRNGPQQLFDPLLLLVSFLVVRDSINLECYYNVTVYNVTLLILHLILTLLFKTDFLEIF